MAVYADRVRETTITAGTGTYSLSGAATGFRTFSSALTSGVVVTYCADDGTNWEIGQGTFTAGSPSTVSRTTILSSSNANAAVSWGSGSKYIYLTASATRLVMNDASSTITGTLTATGFAGPLTGAASANVLKAGDTMTGALSVQKSAGSAFLNLNDTVENWSASLTTTGSTSTFELNNATTTTLLRVMRNGNVGVGMTPTQKLDVSGIIQASSAVYFGGGVGKLNFSGSDAYIDSTGALILRTGGSNERLRIDANGNLGLGVTPFAWDTSNGLKALDLGVTGTLYSTNAATASVTLGNNVYVSGGSILRKAADYASYYLQNSGSHQFYVTNGAAAGGTAPTMTQALTISNTGNVGIGGTPTAKLHVTSTGDNSAWIESTGTVNSAALQLRSGNGTTSARYSYVSYLSNETTPQEWRAGMYSNVNFVIRDHTNTSNRLTIDTTGNVGVGVTPASGFKLDVGTSSGSAYVRVKTTDATADSAFVAQNSAGNGLSLGTYGASHGAFGAVGAGESYLYSSAPNVTICTDVSGGSIKFATGTSNLERMRIDASGNIGVNVTPAAWHTSARAVQMGTGGALWNYSTSQINLSQGLYYDSAGFKYANTGVAASTMSMNSGAFYFQQAVSGTAGTAPTLTTPLQISATGDTYITGNLYMNASTVGLHSGSASWPLIMGINGTEKARIDTSGRLGVGVSPGFTIDVKAPTSTDCILNLNTTTGTNQCVLILNQAGAANCYFGLAGNAGDLVGSSAAGDLVVRTASKNIRFTVNSGTSQAAILDSNGNLLVTGAGGLGYGTGSGGTVTQLTSKTTGVTLNKTNGQITMNAAALAAGAIATFVVTNSTVAATDVPFAVLKGGYATYGTYNVQAEGVGAGSFVVTVKNISGGSLSEALVLNFAVIKAVTA